jgi:hypothetical protein
MSLPPGSPHLDAAESLFVERALLYVEAETYNTLFPPLEGRRFVPVDNKADPGAKFTSYKQYTRTGIARLVTERGLDLPTANLFVKEYFHPFFRLGMSYQYTLDDLLAAGMAAKNGGPPVNLDLELALAAREGIEKKLDNIARVGAADGLQPSVGMVGLLNQPSATIFTVPNGAAGSQAWSSKTPDEIIADMTGIVAAQIAGTFKVEQPDTMLLPISQYETIAGRSMGDGRSDSILSYFMKISRHITQVDSWQFLAGAGSGPSDRMVVYKKDPRKVRHMISQEFTQMPPRFENFVYTTECTAKSAGVVCPYPLSISYGDGI